MLVSLTDTLSPGKLSLDAYNEKRDFTQTSEPVGEYLLTGQSRFVIQKHIATRTHFDLRLEHDGRLLSWAVTRGPSLTPADKRLAVRTEDHPAKYIDFEGIIASGYGKGRMIVWDTGHFEPVISIEAGLPKGEIKFHLHGHRLRGQFALIRMKSKKADKQKENWLLVKDRDAYAAEDFDPVELFTTSVISGKSPEALTSAGASAGPVPIAGSDQDYDFALAELADCPPGGEKWIHEIKYDGYRVQVDTRGGLTIRTRNGLDWTDRFPGAVDQLAGLPRNCVLDGELVAPATDGRPTFSALRKDLEAGGKNTRVMFFDCLCAAGRDVRRETVRARRLILRNLLSDIAPGALVEFIHGDGSLVFEQTRALGLEGVVSKQIGSPYPAGRSNSWIKSKHVRSDTFWIGGYRTSKVRGRPFASLLIGSRNESGSLTYRGRVGSGFGDDDLKQISNQLNAHVIKTCPFSSVPASVRKDAKWVTPELAVKVTHAGFTSNQQLRHARFIRLADGPKTAPEKTGFTLPIPITHLTSGDDVIDVVSGRKKRDVVAYYEAMADVFATWAMPRPQTFLNAPNGIGAETFFVRNAARRLPKGVRPIKSLSALRVSDPLAYARLAQNRMIEIHLMGSTVRAPSRPDRLVFDLDPDEALAWSTVAGAAQLVRALLEAAGFAPRPLLTGGKGVHLVCYVEGSPDWDEFVSVARGLASDIAHAEPKLFTSSQSKTKRAGRIYLDWMRNRRSSTAISPWSLRARPGLPVAVPTDWADFPETEVPQISLESAWEKATKSNNLAQPVLTSWPAGLVERYMPDT